jgi:DNA-directed RNA polymerase specialized sigma24 family protein
MFRYIRAFFSMIAGWFGSKSSSLEENKHVMAATYDNAIAQGRNRFETVKNAVAELIGVEQELTIKVKNIGAKIETKNKIKTGAQTAMQQRLDTLRKKSMSKEEILADVEFIKHKTAYDDASAELVKLKTEFDDKDETLRKRKQQIATYKAELQTMQRQNDSLKDEKQEAIADVAIAQQSEALNAVLAGIPQNTTDQDLDRAREARKRVVNRSNVTAELVGNDAKKADNEYLAMANQSQSTAELDKLLDWGDEPKKEETLNPAKLPE